MGNQIYLLQQKNEKLFNLMKMMLDQWVEQQLELDELG